MSDFLTELEDDIREEKLLALWKKYGHFLVGIAVAIVVATAGHTLWNYFSRKTRLQHFASFSEGVRLFQEGNNDKAREIFKTLATQKDGYGKLAQLYEAALTPDGAPVYQKIANENPSNPALSHLSKFLGASPFKDASSPAALESLASPRSAWAPLALEFLGFYELQRGDSAKAVDYYTKALQENYLTPSEKGRVSMMIAQMKIPLGASLKKDRPQQ